MCTVDKCGVKVSRCVSHSTQYWSGIGTIILVVVEYAFWRTSTTKNLLVPKSKICRDSTRTEGILWSKMLSPWGTTYFSPSKIIIPFMMTKKLSNVFSVSHINRLFKSPCGDLYVLASDPGKYVLEILLFQEGKGWISQAR